jgi:glycogen debranching enzyme
VIHRQVVATPLGPVSLASDETLVGIDRCPVALPAEPESPLHVLLRLAGVDTVDELGNRGPVLASAVNPENAGNPEVRRYEAVFGRDALYAAEFLHELYPQLEDETVRYLAAFQATGADPSSQAEPGKVANHIRSPDDPLARALTRETGRGWPWYGATDTTVQFLSALCRLLQRHPNAISEPVLIPPGQPGAGRPIERAGRPLRLSQVAVNAARWLQRGLRAGPVQHLLWVGMNDRDSFTVWTDSPNAFSSPSGRLPNPPVAPVQLQAQVYEALTGLADAAERLPELHLDGADLLAEAEHVRQAMLEAFFVEDERGVFLAAAVESARAGSTAGRPRPVASRTVNAGFALTSGLLDTEAHRGLREAVVRQLFCPSMSSVFGIVGRARDEVRFEVFDYHSQVWGFAVHRVARGLDRSGYPLLARELDARVMRQIQDGLLPENVGGSEGPELAYCPHVLRVSRQAPDGRPTVTVKERPPAPYAAWTAAAVVAIDFRARTLQIEQRPATTFEAEVLASLPNGHRGRRCQGPST